MVKDKHKITLENRRILVIDDNLKIHEDFRKILAPAAVCGELDQLGASLFDEGPQVNHNEVFEVGFADQGQVGLHMVEQSVAARAPYALAFVDMRMPPGWDGLLTIEQIWKADPNIQVVICTAFSDHPWREISARLGKTDRLLILRKPFDAIEVEQLAVALTCKWELSQRAQLRIDGINAVVDLRYKELLERNTQLKVENEQFQTLNEQFQQFVKELRRTINTEESSN